MPADDGDFSAYFLIKEFLDTIEYEYEFDLPLGQLQFELIFLWGIFWNYFSHIPIWRTDSFCRWLNCFRSNCLRLLLLGPIREPSINLTANKQQIIGQKSNYTRQTKQQQPVLDFIVVAAVDTLTALAAFELQPICLSVRR